MLGASVNDPGWLRQLPADRPVLIIAEGLLCTSRKTTYAGCSNG